MNKEHTKPPSSLYPGQGNTSLHPRDLHGAIQDGRVRVRSVSNLPRSSAAGRTSDSRGYIMGGPFTKEDHVTLCRLPGKAPLIVFELLQQRARQRGVLDELTLPNALLDDYGIDKAAKSRALSALEKAGFVSIARTQGNTARLSIVRTLLGLPSMTAKPFGKRGKRELRRAAGVA